MLAIPLPLPYACNILPLTPLVSIIIRGSEMLLTPLSGSNPPYIATWFFITNGIPCVSYVPTNHHPNLRRTYSINGSFQVCCRIGPTITTSCSCSSGFYVYNPITITCQRSLTVTMNTYY